MTIPDLTIAITALWGLQLLICVYLLCALRGVNAIHRLIAREIDSDHAVLQRLINHLATSGLAISIELRGGPCDGTLLSAPAGADSIRAAATTGLHTYRATNERSDAGAWLYRHDPAAPAPAPDERLTEADLRAIAAKYRPAS